VNVQIFLKIGGYCTKLEQIVNTMRILRNAANYNKWWSYGATQNTIGINFSKSWSKDSIVSWNL